MDIPEIFRSRSSLRSAFEAGLDRQLAEKELGTFILVLANALFDESIFDRFRDPLHSGFSERRKTYSELLIQGRTPNDAVDDMVVFLKLCVMGFESLQTTRYRTTDRWEFQFNQLRSLRPRRMAGGEISRLSCDFNPDGFNFNKPFLDKEVFWSGEIDGMPLKLLYNKFPFATMHGLLVPEPEKNHSQVLRPDIHRFICSFCRQIGKTIPGFAIAYNAYGAGASVNHLHFQTFVRTTPLPIQANCWTHNGGNTDYPVACEVFAESAEAWRYIESLHSRNLAYNLLYLPDRVVCLPRRFQGSFTMPEWCESFAWYELCGGVTTFNSDDYAELDDKAVTNALEQLRITG